MGFHKFLIDSAGEVRIQAVEMARLEGSTGIEHMALETDRAWKQYIEAQVRAHPP